MRLTTAALAAFGALGLPSAAFAACDLRVQSPGEVRFTGEDGGGYDSFARSRGEVEFMVVIENRDTSAACNGLLSIQRDTAGGGLEGAAGVKLDYRVSQAGSLVSVVDLQTDVGRPPNAVAISIAPGSTIVQRMSFSVLPQQVAPSGPYRESVLLRILDATDLTLAIDRSLELATVVQSQASVLLFDGGIANPAQAEGGTRDRQLDFHTLENGEEATLTVLVQANDNYSVRFGSLNRGRLAHVTLGAAETVDYSVFFGGQEIGLDSGDASVTGRPATGLVGVSQPLRIRIGDVGVAHAGRYEDQLTISIVPD